MFPSDYMEKHMDNLIRLGGKRYSGSVDRVVSGALYFFHLLFWVIRHASHAFVQTGHGVWSLNTEVANEIEKETYERFLDREKHRKRRRRSNASK